MTVVEKVVNGLGFLPKDADAANVGRRVRGILDDPEEKADSSETDNSVPNITSLGTDSPKGEPSAQPSNTKADHLATKDIERLEVALAALKDAAKKINRSAARRAVEAQPDTAVPLIQEIGATLQQIDRAVAIRLPKPEWPHAWMQDWPPSSPERQDPAVRHWWHRRRAGHLTGSGGVTMSRATK
ncbi:hypothetical protein [Streptomyces sp. NPDC057199]|uniref:hypothetical protein n=1 Tax=Streptomyces sp. NPDC057199 TaxID=3346047 RepID=UPI00363C7AAB